MQHRMRVLLPERHTLECLCHATGEVQGSAYVPVAAEVLAQVELRTRVVHGLLVLHERHVHLIARLVLRAGHRV